MLARLATVCQDRVITTARFVKSVGEDLQISERAFITHSLCYRPKKGLVPSAPGRIERHRTNGVAKQIVEDTATILLLLVLQGFATELPKSPLYPKLFSR
jgi:hypothetical protein